MERSELIAKLSKEAAGNTPDVYDKILQAARAEGLLKGGGRGAASYGGARNAANGVGGGAVKQVGGAVAKSRALGALAAIVAAVMATAAVAVPLALNIKDGLNGGPQIEAPDGDGGSLGDNSGGNSGDNSGGQTPTDPDDTSKPTDPDNPAPPVPPADPTNADRLRFNFIYNYSYGLEVTGFDSADKPLEVKIPSEYNGYKVVAIAAHAFNSQTLVSSVSIPATVTNIRSNAFNSCGSLQRVTRYREAFAVSGDSSHITHFADTESGKPFALEAHAFVNCNNLISVELPEPEEPAEGWSNYMGDAISEAEADAFYGCERLETIALPNSIRFDQNAQNDNFYHCVVGQCDSLKTINVPLGLQILPKGFLNGCGSLENIIIPEGIREIYCNVLVGTAVKQLHIPASVYKIYGNSSLNTVEKITVAADSKHFYVKDDCLIQIHSIVSALGQYEEHELIKALKTGSVPNDGSVRVIAGYAFDGLESGGSFAVPDGVERLEHYALSGFGQLNEVTLPASLEYIGAEVFGSFSETEKIKFKGTVAQWNKITKDKEWNAYAYGTKNYTVACMDGTIRV